MTTNTEIKPNSTTPPVPLAHAVETTGETPAVQEHAAPPCCGQPSPQPEDAPDVWLCTSCGAIRTTNSSTSEVELSTDSLSPCCNELGWRMIGADAPYTCTACGATRTPTGANVTRATALTPFYDELANKYPDAALQLAADRYVERRADPTMQPPGHLPVFCVHGGFVLWSPTGGGPLPCARADCEPTRCEHCDLVLSHNGMQWLDEAELGCDGDMRRCIPCGGNGWIPDGHDGPIDCQACEGSGEVTGVHRPMVLDGLTDVMPAVVEGAATETAVVPILTAVE